MNVDYSGLQKAAGLKFESAGSIGSIISAAIPYILAIAGIILLLNLLWGGISLMLTRGDPKAIEAAKAKITTSLIGFIIVFVAYWIVQIAATILDLQTIKSIFR